MNDMDVDKLNLSPNLWFEHYEHSAPTITYIEHSDSYCGSDSEIDIDLDEESAKAIVLWLQEKFNLDI